jgi:hypothetical protein
MASKRKEKEVDLASVEWLAIANARATVELDDRLIVLQKALLDLCDAVLGMEKTIAKLEGALEQTIADVRALEDAG